MRGHTWRVCVVGPSTRFLSGITYYTYSLCQALSARCEVSAILMRQLLPTRLYPGHARVGAAMSALALPPTVRRVDGVDWFWVPTLGRALWLLAHRRISSMTSLCSSVRPAGRVYASMINRLRRERGVSLSLVLHHG